MTPGQPLPHAYTQENVELVEKGCANMERRIFSTPHLVCVYVCAFLCLSFVRVAVMHCMLLSLYWCKHWSATVLPPPSFFLILTAPDAADIQNLRKFGIAVVVAVNRFTSDTEAEIEVIKKRAVAAGAFGIPIYRSQ